MAEEEKPKTPEQDFTEFLTGLPGDLTRSLDKLEPVFPSEAVSPTVLQGLREGKTLELAREWDRSVEQMEEKLDAPLFKAAESIRNRPSWTPIPPDIPRNMKV